MDEYLARQLERIADNLERQPAEIFRPKVTRLSNGKWLAYYGDSPADAIRGVCPSGEGNCPGDAVAVFNQNWWRT